MLRLTIARRSGGILAMAASYDAAAAVVARIERGDEEIDLAAAFAKEADALTPEQIGALIPPIAGTAPAEAGMSRQQRRAAENVGSQGREKSSVMTFFVSEPNDQEADPWTHPEDLQEFEERIDDSSHRLVLVAEWMLDLTHWRRLQDGKTRCDDWYSVRMDGVAQLEAKLPPRERPCRN
ncbi:MAG TPA: hypothetical protein VMH05_05600 [Bryobacteraceae bacterium]|nr:hypothetical protein [Bryobacteraceae bacterium]